MTKNQKPTYIKATIMDWKYQRISSGRLFEILRTSYQMAYCALLDEHEKTGKWFDIPAERIEELVMTKEGLTARALQDLADFRKEKVTSGST